MMRERAQMRSIAAAWLVAVGTSACHSAPPIAQQQPDHALLASYGLNCGRCMHSQPTSCAYTSQAPVVAIVTALDDVVEDKECLRGEPSDHKPCFVTAAGRFTIKEYLRKPATATANDRFIHHYDYDWDTSALERGIRLGANESYLIFAGPADRSTRPAGEWYVTTACLLPTH
jgi:hypothetical protein